VKCSGARAELSDAGVYGHGILTVLSKCQYAGYPARYSRRIAYQARLYGKHETISGAARELV
jgi:hypothetical protein